MIHGLDAAAQPGKPMYETLCSVLEEIWRAHEVLSYVNIWPTSELYCVCRHQDWQQTYALVVAKMRTFKHFTESTATQIRILVSFLFFYLIVTFHFSQTDFYCHISNGLEKYAWLLLLRASEQILSNVCHYDPRLVSL